MYTIRNFKTKRALKEAIARGDKVGVYQPGDWIEQIMLISLGL